MGGNLIGPGHPGFGPRAMDPYASDPFGVGGPRLPPYTPIPSFLPLFSSPLHEVIANFSSSSFSLTEEQCPQELALTPSALPLADPTSTFLVDHEAVVVADLVAVDSAAAAAVDLVAGILLTPFLSFFTYRPLPLPSPLSPLSLSPLPLSPPSLPSLSPLPLSTLLLKLI